jgi:hypothetical protein
MRENAGLGQMILFMDGHYLVTAFLEEDYGSTHIGCQVKVRRFPIWVCFAGRRNILFELTERIEAFIKKRRHVSPAKESEDTPSGGDQQMTPA